MLISCSIPNENTVVAIQPYENVSKAEIDTVSKTLSEFHNVQTIVLSAKNHDKETFVNVKSPRYRADKIILQQKFEKSDSIDYVLGLTSKDISTSKKENGKIKEPRSKYEDWGIMGLAYLSGESCVVSTFRIKHKNQAVYFSRIKKVSVHELGHNFGLPHCPDKKCIMTDAVESVSTIDNAKLELCNFCKNKLK